jgi:hypothetical protein
VHLAFDAAAAGKMAVGSALRRHSPGPQRSELPGDGGEHSWQQRAQLAAAQVAGHRWLTSAGDWEAERWVHPDAHGGATGGAALATPDAGSEAAREVVGRARPFPVMSFSPW